jgi:hypothetical protein
MATTASYTSMADMSASVAREAESLYKRIYELDSSIENWGLRQAHLEVLDGIAQNIISLKLTHYQNVEKAREHFNNEWEDGGEIQYPFEGLYEACSDSLSQFLHPLSFPDYDRY